MSLSGWTGIMFDPKKQVKLLSGKYEFQNPQAQAAYENIKDGQIFDKETFRGINNIAHEASMGTEVTNYLDDKVAKWGPNDMGPQNYHKYPGAGGQAPMTQLTAQAGGGMSAMPAQTALPTMQGAPDVTPQVGQQYAMKQPAADQALNAFLALLSGKKA
jgi:hypothetical protein